MTTDHRRRDPLDRALTLLDAAPAGLDAAGRERARAVRERVLATPPPARRRIRRRRIGFALVPATALAVLVGTATLRDGGGGAEFASWTATPSGVAADDLAAVTAACSTALRDDDTFRLDGSRRILAERRGDHVVVVWARDEPAISATCLARNEIGSDDVDDVGIGIAGSSGPAVAPPPGTFRDPNVQSSSEVSVVDGLVGPDVTGLTIHAGRFTVQATVAGGRYAAWWPGPAMTDDGARSQLLLSYDVTLADGTVLQDAQPVLP